MQSFSMSLLLAATLSMTAMTARVDDPIDGAGLPIISFSDDKSFESSVASTQLEQASDVLTATKKADSSVDAAQEADLNAAYFDAKATQVSAESSRLGGKAESAMGVADQLRGDAKVAAVHAHLQSVNAAAAGKLHEVSYKTSAKTNFIEGQANHKVETIKLSAIETIKAGHRQAEDRVHQNEADTLKQIHESESIAAKRVSDYQRASKEDTDARLQTQSAHAAEKINEAHMAAQARINRATDSANADISRVQSSAATQIENINHRITAVNSMVQRQITMQEEAANRKVITLEANARDAVAKGEAQAKETISRNNERASRKVQEQDQKVAEKRTFAQEEIKHMGVEAEANIARAQSAAIQAGVKAQNNAKFAISELLTKRARDSAVVARTKKQRVAYERLQALGAEKYKAQKEKVVKDAEVVLSKALQQATASNMIAQNASLDTVEANLNLAQVSAKAARGTTDEAFPVNVAAAKAHQKALDVSNFAKFEAARAKSERDRVSDNQYHTSGHFIDAKTEHLF